MREQPHEVRTNRTNDPVGIVLSDEFATRDAGPTVERLRTELLALMAATGLTPQNDAMPMDEGIKKELPAQNIR